jgi:acetyl/propionyl-CoA carboxylase alpha subunit
VSTYVALLDGGKREVALDVTQQAPGIYEVRIGDRVHVVDAFQHDYGTLSLIVDTQSYTAMIDERGSHLRVQVRDSVFPLEILDEKKLRMMENELRSPKDGKVVELHVKEGQAVEGNARLCAVE